MPDTVQIRTDEVIPPREAQVGNGGELVAAFTLVVSYDAEPTSQVSPTTREAFARRASRSAPSSLVPGTRIPMSALASSASLAEEWDRPEEDEACRRSRPAT